MSLSSLMGQDRLADIISGTRGRPFDEAFGRRLLHLDTPSLRCLPREKCEEAYFARQNRLSEGLRSCLGLCSIDAVKPILREITGTSPNQIPNLMVTGSNPVGVTNIFN